MHEVIQTVMALQELSIREFSFQLENVPFRTSYSYKIYYNVRDPYLNGLFKRNEAIVLLINLYPP